MSPFFSVELYRVTDVPEYRALFPPNKDGNVIIRIAGDHEAWVWGALSGSLKILYAIVDKVEVGNNEWLYLAKEF